MSKSRNRTRYNPLAFYFINHIRAFLLSFGELLRAPYASLMTLAVIGITMALPAGLYVLLQNFQQIGDHWDGRPTLSVYLQTNLDQDSTQQTLRTVKNIHGVAEVSYISPKQGLQQFERMTHLGNSLSNLDNNPLPGVVVVIPSIGEQSPQALRYLSQRIETLPHVGTVQLDLSWIKRLFYLITIAKRVIYAMAILFGLGVILITGNTIRLTTQNHQREIAILRLIGATGSFIRRPLLYRGLIYGFTGGLFAWILVSITVWWLSDPIRQLVATYGNQAVIQGLGFGTGLSIVIISSILGLIGSYFAVNQHLNAEESI